MFDSDDAVSFTCSTESKHPELKLEWKLTGNGIIEKEISQVTEEMELEDGRGGFNKIVSQVSFKRQPGSGETQVNVICLVSGRGMENHAQKIVKDIRENDFDRFFHAEIWDIVERNSSDEDFEVPEEFEFVDINEDNFRNFVSKIQHLLNEEIGEKMGRGLVGFIKSVKKFEVDLNNGTNNDADVNVAWSCVDSESGCCPDLLHPRHGDQDLGCCAASEFGCCPDNITPAPAPFLEVSMSQESRVSPRLVSENTKRKNVRLAP